MDDVTKVKIKNNKVILPCGRKLLIYRPANINGSIEINPRFIELWNLLQWTDNFIDISEDSEDVSNGYYDLPDRSGTKVTSNHREVGTDLCVFTTKDQNGPISISNGNESWYLVTNQSNIFYTISWESSVPTQISFLSEWKEGKLIPITSIQNEVCVFEGTNGQFETWDYPSFVIHSSINSQINIFFQVLVPKNLCNEIVPSTKYLYFCHRCERYKFKVYDLRKISQNGISEVIVNKHLTRTKKGINKTLLNLSIQPFISFSAVGLSQRANFLYSDISYINLATVIYGRNIFPNLGSGNDYFIDWPTNNINSGLSIPAVVQSTIATNISLIVYRKTITIKLKCVTISKQSSVVISVLNGNVSYLRAFFGANPPITGYTSIVIQHGVIDYTVVFDFKDDIQMSWSKCPEIVVLMVTIDEFDTCEFVEINVKSYTERK